MVKQILVIDDDMKSYELVADVCELDGYQPIYVHDGESGIVLARDSQPDLIILDVLLPMMQGGDVVAILKASPVTRHIPLIIISGHADTETIEQVLANGADNYLEKPFDAEYLRALINQYLAPSAPT